MLCCDEQVLRCTCCGRFLLYEAHHVAPMSKGFMKNLRTLFFLRVNHVCHLLRTSRHGLILLARQA